MTRAADLKARLANVAQIETIVSALRAVALGQRREAERRLEAVRAHEAAVAGAMARALALAPPPTAQQAGQGASLLIVMGAGQGFAGAYGERLAHAALAQSPTEIFVLGRRTAEALEEADAPLRFRAEAPAHAGDAPALASRLADALIERLARGDVSRVTLLFAEPDAEALTLRPLIPFDYARFPPHAGPAPLLTLPPETLLQTLVEEYLFAELAEAALLAFAAESEARADAMSRAQTNVRRIAQDLERDAAHARQAALTAEIVELSLHAEG
ncbi:F0F1 ATP synthase subunit gamma [Albimonas sp. CAU 1670]|uniref:F0F1 ATP synthase subunit gamma n=1 Tax=Albimonas sp. CAU 1670 TaxID=3032599 RepID=UPI0023DC9A34|nr:F0F1 ATP synthase subunit gamma [Albimonas sp. CAU 1670]MDF2235453.1 F0F1 ATP synthase subunit gamma [Albimonas sp. CAU 1670]